LTVDCLASLCDGLDRPPPFSYQDRASFGAHLYILCTLFILLPCILTPPRQLLLLIMKAWEAVSAHIACVHNLWRAYLWYAHPRYIQDSVAHIARSYIRMIGAVPCTRYTRTHLLALCSHYRTGTSWHFVIACHMQFIWLLITFLVDIGYLPCSAFPHWGLARFRHRLYTVTDSRLLD
jgi:hypothetical protein